MEEKEERTIKKEKISKKKLIIILSIITVVVLGSIALILAINGNRKSPKIEEKKKEKVVEEVKKVSIVDLNNTNRPYAVMINNHYNARPQAGLEKAYIVYEFMVEGGITRMMALYTTDVDVKKIGSVRSSRHYYLDYALENDAIYVHWGTSIYAEKDIHSLGINNIDGMNYGGIYFTTDSSLGRSLEHTRFTSSDMIKNGIKGLGYRTKREKDYLLNYTADEVDLSKKEGIVANKIDIRYSNYMTANYSYNADEKVYYRSIDNNAMKDLVTGEQYKFKNIIAYSVAYSSISDYGHQDIKNVGEGEGYYFTNGYGVKIKWSKKSRGEQTKYYYQDGKEIDVSDGNTFIQVYPTSGSLNFS